MSMKYVLDCDMMKERVQAHEYIARVLSFPEYYGKNLDALYDCLTDMTDCEIEIINTEKLPQKLKGILRVMRDAAESNDTIRLSVR